MLRTLALRAASRSVNPVSGKGVQGGDQNAALKPSRRLSHAKRSRSARVAPRCVARSAVRRQDKRA